MTRRRAAPLARIATGLALAVSVALAAGVAWAQSAHVAVGKIAEGPGTIRGRVVREANPEKVGGLDVALYAMPEAGAPGIARTVTGADGGFDFTGVSNDPTTVYLVGVRSDGLPYSARTTFAEGEDEASVVLEIDEPTHDTSAAELGDALLRIDRACTGLRVNEAHELRNDSQRVLYVPEERRAQQRPIFEAELPAAAHGFTAPFGVVPQGLEVEGHRVRFWGPLPPGGQELEFGYALPAETGAVALERGFPAGAPRLTVLTDAAGPVARGEGLVPAQGRDIEGRPYRALAAASVAPGERLRLEIEIPEPPPTRVGATESQIWLELDEAAMLVDEQHELWVEGDEALVAESDAPLLCLPVPPQASGLRFSSGTLAMGLATDPNGVLTVRGPIPAGESAIAVRYRLPVQGAPVSFQRRLPFALETLSVFIADTGIVPTTSLLHPIRPLRGEDRSYLRLQGFGIAANEPLEIDLERLGSPRPMPRLALAGIGLLGAAVTIAFLVGPLRGPETLPTPGETDVQRFAAEREGVYAAIRDLEEDFDTGKLTREDYDTLLGELRARAVALLRAEREVASPAPAAPAPAGCSECKAELPPQARFCPQCGTRVEVGESGA